MCILSYVTTYDVEGEPLLRDMPIAEAPARMESDSERLVVTSIEALNGSWEHLYIDRNTGHYHRMIVRPA